MHGSKIEYQVGAFTLAVDEREHLCGAAQSEALGNLLPALGAEDEDRLRTMILTMVHEPLVIVVKLADRLHNMRTVRKP